MSLDKIQTMFNGVEGVRTVIAIAFTGAVIYGFIITKEIGADVFMGMAGIVIGFFFNRATTPNTDTNGTTRP